MDGAKRNPPIRIAGIPAGIARPPSTVPEWERFMDRYYSTAFASLPMRSSTAAVLKLTRAFAVASLDLPCHGELAASDREGLRGIIAALAAFIFLMSFSSVRKAGFFPPCMFRVRTHNPAFDAILLLGPIGHGQNRIPSLQAIYYFGISLCHARPVREINLHVAERRATPTNKSLKQSARPVFPLVLGCFFWR